MNTLWNNVILPAILSLFVGLILYNVQMLFETTQKQIEYTEKLDNHLKEYIFKINNMANKKTTIYTDIIMKYKNISDKLINENNNSNIILDKYISEIGKISIPPKCKRDQEVSELKIEIAYLKQYIYDDLTYLKIYANDKLINLSKGITSSLKILDKIDIKAEKYMETSIIESSNLAYLVKNITTVQDLKNHMLKEYNQKKKLKKEINNLKKENTKAIKTMEKGKQLLLKNIHYQLNQNGVIRLFKQLFKGKTNLF